MNRKEFVKAACKYGFCGCMGMSFLNATKSFSESNDVAKEQPDWRIAFMQKRFAKLIAAVGSKVNSETRNELLEQMGRECAKEGLEKIQKFKGDVEGFLKHIQEQWGDEAEFDASSNEIRIQGKKRDQCFCPFVDQSLTPKDFCNCSMGWQKEIYEMILGKKVDVRIDSSVLRGDERCGMTIKPV
jgi:predicted ArsR family transcriptional regulator